MKKFLALLLSSFLLAGCCDAQRLYQTCFNSCLGLPFDNEMEGIKLVEATDGNGSVSLIKPINAHDGDDALFLTKIDSLGTEQWNKKIKLNFNTILIHNINDTIIQKQLSAEDIVKFGNNGYFISAIVDSLTSVYDSSGQSIFSDYKNTSVTFLVDQFGNVVWDNQIYFPPETLHSKMIYDDTNGFLYLGTYSFYNDSVFYLTKFDTTGNQIWTNEFDGLANVIFSAQLNFKDNYIYAGLDDRQDCILIKIDSSGTVQWSRKFDSGLQDNLIGVLPLANGIVLGVNKKTAPHSVLILVDTSGNISYAKSFESDTSYYLMNLVQYPNNEMMIVQRSDSQEFYGDIVKDELMTIDSGGTILTHRNIYFHEHNYSAYDFFSIDYVNFICSNDKLYLLTQESNYYHQQGTTCTLPFVYLLDTIGDFCLWNSHTLQYLNITSEYFSDTVSGITSHVINSNTVPMSLVFFDSLLTSHSYCSQLLGKVEFYDEHFLEISPNPTSNELTVNSSEFGVKIELTICDVFGREVYSDHMLTANYNLQTTNWKPGVYFVRVSNGERCTVKKVVIE